MEEVTELMDSFEKKFEKGNYYTNSEIKQFFAENGIGKNSQHPASFTYNVINDGTAFFFPVFEYEAHNSYVYRGPNYLFNGELKHRPQGQGEEVVLGTWKNGILDFSGPETKRLSEHHIVLNLSRIVIYEAKKSLKRLERHFDFLADNHL